VIELRDHSHGLCVFLDWVGVEIAFLKQIAEFAQRDAARYRLDVARHVVCDNLFKKGIQG